MTTSCRVGNSILVFCIENFDGYVECKLFNPVNKQWNYVDIETKQNWFAAAKHLNKVWIIGGRNPSKILDTIEIYDPVDKTHELLPTNLIQGRWGHRVVVYKNKLYVFGGEHQDAGLLNTVEMYSPEEHKFVMTTPMKTARSDFGCCRVGNLVYVIGGYSLSGKTNSVEIFNLDTHTWTDGVDFPVAEHCLLACAVNNKIE